MCKVAYARHKHAASDADDCAIRSTEAVQRAESERTNEDILVHFIEQILS